VTEFYVFTIQAEYFISVLFATESNCCVVCKY